MFGGKTDDDDSNDAGLTAVRSGRSHAGRLIAMLAAGIGILGVALWWFHQQSLRPVLADLQVVLDEVPCSALVATASERSVTVSGFATQSVELAGAAQVVAGLQGVGTLSMAVTGVDRSYCRLLDFYAPYWKVNRVKKLGTAMSTSKPDDVFVDGEPLIVDVSAPLYRSYLYVDYHFHDGFVVHLLPDQRSGPIRLNAGAWLSLGERSDWIISPPFGRQMIAVIASPVPLFADIRQRRESDGDYLAMLNERLKADSTGTEGRPVTADFLFITTKPRVQ